MLSTFVSKVYCPFCQQTIIRMHSRNNNDDDGGNNNNNNRNIMSPLLTLCVRRSFFFFFFFARAHLERSNDRCVNSDITLEQKLTLNAAANDYNNDGLVTAEDITYDLTNNYDTDSEFCIIDDVDPHGVVFRGRGVW